MRKSTIENLKTCQPREQNMQLSFDKRCSFPAQNSAFSLGQTRLMSGKLSRLKSKHTRKNRHASGLNVNGSNINTVNTHSAATNINDTLTRLPKQFIWENDSSQKFRAALQSNDLQKLIHDFLIDERPDKDINTTLDEIENILTTPLNVV